VASKMFAEFASAGGFLTTVQEVLAQN